MQTNPYAESFWLYHSELWQEPSLVSKLHFSQADDMCQALIPSATPACQLRKGFRNAFGFFEIPQVPRQQLTPTLSWGWTLGQEPKLKWIWRFLIFTEIIPTFSLAIKINSSPENSQRFCKPLPTSGSHLWLEKSVKVKQQLINVRAWRAFRVLITYSYFSFHTVDSF